MADILLRSLGFVLIIILGYVIKKTAFLGDEGYKVIGKIVINITLPAVIIHSFIGFKGDRSFIAVVLIGLGMGIILMLLGILLSHNKNGDKKILYIINFPGYNIGNFSLPFIQSFVGAAGVVTTCMFDVGNAMVATGFSYAIATTIAGQGEKKGAISILKQIMRSAPLVTYVLMVIITVTGIKLPKIVEIVSDTVGKSNGFLSMFLIGLMFDIKFKKEYFQNAGIILVVRLIVAAAAAFVIYYMLPLSMDIKKVLVILVFSPLTSLAPIFTEKAHGQRELSGFISALSIIFSIVIIIFLINIMKL